MDEVASDFIGFLAREKVTRRADGAVVKFEHCSRCHADFVYLTHRSATASATNPLWMDFDGAASRADHQAVVRADYELYKAIDPVLCPSCGYLQPHMLREARRERVITTLWIGLPGSIALGVLIGFIASSYFAGLIAMMFFFVMTGVSLLAIYFVFDPNKGKELLWPLNQELARSGLAAEAYWESLEVGERLEEERIEAQARNREEENRQSQARHAAYEAEAARRRSEAEEKREAERARVTERARDDQPPRA